MAEIAASHTPDHLPKVLAGLVVLLFLVPYYHTHHHAKPAPGPLVREEPEITPLDGKTVWQVKGYSMTALASCRLHARVLHTERYYFDRESDLSPVDLAVGWRGMSDSRYLDQMDITQGGRWYFFEYKEPPLPNEVISAESKNIHILPATREIASQVKSVQTHQVVRLSGSLVKVTGPDGYIWTSSLSTGGSGDGSCWVFWVDRMDVEN